LARSFRRIMTLPVFHPCRFNFDDQDIRRVGSVTSGGNSLSGIDDPIETDGGGFWQADFTNGATLEREDTLAWRAINAAMDNGASAVIVRFCDRLHQPVGGEMGVAGSPFAFGDRRAYARPGVVARATALAALRATTIRVDIDSEQPVIGGERFTIVHATWGERVYEVVSVGDGAITIRPPLREAIAANTPLDFDDPRCKMRRASDATNALNIGRYGQCLISFVEDMRKPA
jgi:hypothetical protein